uniref:Transmembrane protein n=2 Tax=Arabidopsis thaliana TaxID=3702 RepID=Q1PDI0_ARATH|nr:unknown [Arabidopsis thaliana]
MCGVKIGSRTLFCVLILMIIHSLGNFFEMFGTRFLFSALFSGWFILFI